MDDTVMVCQAGIIIVLIESTSQKVRIDRDHKYSKHVSSIDPWQNEKAASRQNFKSTRSSASLWMTSMKGAFPFIFCVFTSWSDVTIRFLYCIVKGNKSYLFQARQFNIWIAQAVAMPYERKYWRDQKIKWMGILFRLHSAFSNQDENSQQRYNLNRYSSIVDRAFKGK
jgi:hypothetical protein